MLTEDDVRFGQSIKGEITNVFNVSLLHIELNANIELHASICPRVLVIDGGGLFVGHTFILYPSRETFWPHSTCKHLQMMPLRSKTSKNQLAFRATHACPHQHKSQSERNKYLCN